MYRAFYVVLICMFFQIDDIKLMKNHETGRSQGYGFITVSSPSRPFQNDKTNTVCV